MGGLRISALVTAALLAAGVARAQDVQPQPAPSSAPVKGPQPSDQPRQPAMPQTAATPGSAATDATPPTDDQRWALHWQGTFTEQAHPGFRSPYRGAHSLDPAARGNETADITLYAGVRPWKGGEIWIDPEIDQGFGLSNTLGYRNGFPERRGVQGSASRSPYLRMQRLFLRQTIALGGDTSKVDPDLNVLGGSQSANRLVVTLGKFSAVDVFDNNSYAHDPRNDFAQLGDRRHRGSLRATPPTRWEAMQRAVWRFKVYEGKWAFRLGVFDLSDVPNSTPSGSRASVNSKRWRRSSATTGWGDHAGKLPRGRGFLEPRSHGNLCGRVSAVGGDTHAGGRGAGAPVPHPRRHRDRLAAGSDRKGRGRASRAPVGTRATSSPTSSRTWTRPTRPACR